MTGFGISGYEILGQGSGSIGTGSGDVSVTSYCSEDKKVMGGGYVLTDTLSGDQVIASYPDGDNGWKVTIRKNSTNSGSVTVFVVAAYIS